jgi:hypothetical protein
MIHINRLVVLAGPGCVGKSFLIKRIQERSVPLLSEQLELGDPSLWKYVQANRLHEVSESQIEQLLLHFSLFRQCYEKDKALEILHTSEEIIFLTLWATPDILLQRLNQRKTRLFLSFFKLVGFRSKLQRLRLKRIWQQWYTDLPELFFQYNKWFEFCDKYKKNKHWIVDVTENVPKLVPLTKWAGIQGDYIEQPI